MEIKGWIRQGDRTACGGTVVEGDPFITGYGRPYSFHGAKVACKKNCVIGEGYAFSTLPNGRSRVVHGMTTSGGCPLLSTLNDIDGVGNESGCAVPSAFFLNASGQWIAAQEPRPGEVSYDEQTKLDSLPMVGVPYFIETMGGRTFSGRVGADRLLPRINTYGA